MERDKERIHEILDGGIPFSERDGLMACIQSDPDLLREFNELNSTIRMVEDSDRCFLDSSFTREVLSRLPASNKPAAVPFQREIMEAFQQVKTWRWNTAVSLAVIGLMIFGGLLPFLVKNKAPFHSQTSNEKVTIQINFYAPEAKSVSLAGNFNKWKADQSPMQRKGDGLWTIQIPLKPGVYDYMFLIDGKTWLPDSNAPAFRDDGFGYKNSVLRVTPL